METTLIRVSDSTRALLDQLRERMAHEQPQLWPERPSYNAIVGYAAALALEQEEQTP